MDDLFYNKLDQYYEQFQKIFPTMEYQLSPNETIEKIDQCIKQNKTIQELMPLNVPKDAVF